MRIQTIKFTENCQGASKPANLKRLGKRPKVTNPAEPKDLRPINVLPAIFKVLEKILLEQIIGYVEDIDHQLLASNQSGYRKGFSTTTALAKVTHDIYDHFDNEQCTFMVLVDFSLAFNYVDHRKLQRKLREEFCFSLGECELLSAFLEQRTQAVRKGNVTSPQRPVADGTSQGSCLSALLFVQPRHKQSSSGAYV